MALSDVLRALSEMGKEEEQPEILTAECLAHLVDMNSWQLEAIYKHGKRKVKIADDPRCYEYLAEMNSWQLEAIFGDN